jgi:hypothetical protein
MLAPARTFSARQGAARTALRELALQQLRTTRGLPNAAHVIQDHTNCGLVCGLEVCLPMQPRRSPLFLDLDFFSSWWITSGLPVNRQESGPAGHIALQTNMREASIKGELNGDLPR